MAVNLYHAGATDLSNYLDDAAPVPYISRNRDYTLRCETWEISIAMTCPTTLTVGDRIDLKDGSIFLFSGEIIKIVPDADADVYRVSIESSMRLLRSKKLEFSNIYHHFDDTNWYDFTVNGGCYYDWPVVGLIHFMKCAFTVCGLTLTTSNAEDVSYLPLISQTSNADFNGASKSNYTKPKYMFFRGDLLFSINQQVNAGYPAIDSADNDYNANKMNYFEIISEIASRLGFVFETTDYKTYDLRISAEYPTGDLDYLITTDDNDKYEYSDSNFAANDLGETGAAYTDAYILPTSWYYNTTSGAITEKTAGNGRNIKFTPNLEILISDAYDNTNKYADLFAFTRLGIVLANDADAQGDVLICKGLLYGAPITYLETAYALPNQILFPYKSFAHAATIRKYEQPMRSEFVAIAENMIDLARRRSTTLEIY